MNFSLSERQLEILTTIEAYLTRRLSPKEIRWRDTNHIPPYDLLPELGKLGILGLVVPEKWGGLGQDWQTLSLVQERVAQHAYFAGSIINRVVGFGIMTLLKNGTQNQIEKHVPLLVKGQSLMALALTESQAGSDAGAIETRAWRVGNNWQIHGRKVWISDAKGATELLVLARTDPKSQGSQGVTMFMVPSHASGVNMTELHKVGNNAMPSWDVGFDEVEVTDESVLGEINQGFKVLASTLHYSRSSLAATCTGCAEAVLQMTLNHVQERQQFGKPLGQRQVIRHRLADMRMKVDQLRLTVRHLSWLIDTNQDCQRQASQAKVFASETLQFISEQAMQLFASQGYSIESDIQRIWRDSRLYTFGEGTNEIQRDFIARKMGL